jgi:tRNA pseudouridine13 synthase
MNSVPVVLGPVPAPSVPQGREAITWPVANEQTGGRGNLGFSWDDVPLITGELPGTAGRIRGEFEDFQVTEVPAYEPSGSGEHLYLWVEKRGHTTKHLLDELRRQIGVKPVEIGAAGLKDRHAVTRQWISLPVKYEPRIGSFNLEGASVLEVSRHTNKLGLGHLRGNRFSVRVRDSLPGAVDVAMAILRRLEHAGVPNFFGPQRFGRTGRNAERGLELVLDGRMRGPESIPVKRFLIGSLQSLLFNRYLSLRYGRGLYDALLTGDVAKKHDTGGMFTVEDGEGESPRAKALEVSATGPLYGRKVMPALGPSRDLEDEVLAHYGLSWESFKDRKGSRRITRVALTDLAVLPEEDGFRLEFMLPKGSFATVVLREVMKVPVDALGEDAADEGE